MGDVGAEVRVVSSSGGSYANPDIGIPTGEVDALVRRVVDSYNYSSRSLWECAKYTWELFNYYGMYERTFTESLTGLLAINRDTIYHWRKAYDLRVRISEAYPNFDHSGLSISHYYNSADYVERMGIDWVVEFMVTAQDEAWSSRKLSAEMEMATDESGTITWLQKKLNLLSARLEKLYGASEYSGLSDDKRMKLRQAMELIHQIIK